MRKGVLLKMAQPRLGIRLGGGQSGRSRGVGVDEMFGDGIEFGHEPCLGLRVGWYPQGARIVPRRRFREEKRDMRRWSVAKRIQEWGFGTKAA